MRLYDCQDRNSDFLHEGRVDGGRAAACVGYHRALLLAAGEARGPVDDAAIRGALIRAFLDAPP